MTLCAAHVEELHDQKTIIRIGFTSLLALLVSFAPVVAAETVVYTAKLVRMNLRSLKQQQLLLKMEKFSRWVISIA